MTRADLLEAWHGHLAQGRRRSPHTVRAYVATAARLLDELGETDWPALARIEAPALRAQLAQGQHRKYVEHAEVDRRPAHHADALRDAVREADARRADHP